MLIVLEGKSLCDELLHTTMRIVEQSLKSQPISPLSSDHQDFEALTPNHFCLGRPRNASTYIRDTEKDVDSRQMFKIAQAYADFICRRWLKEYIPRTSFRSLSRQ